MQTPETITSEDDMAKQSGEWQPIIEDGDYITSPMPADETEVDVLLDDGSTARAMFHSNVMEAGDFDFVPADDPDGDSLAARVRAWRPTPTPEPRDGGAAFPGEQGQLPDGAWNQEWSAGMSLRDWFAGQALVGILAGNHPITHGSGAENVVASAAYGIADAMLRHRATRQEDQS